MPYITGKVIEWVDDTDYPGTVRIEVIDADGKKWYFTEKNVVVDDDNLLSPDKKYPIDIPLACKIVKKDKDYITVSTQEPWGLETEDGVSEFRMNASQVSKSSPHVK